MDAHLLHVDSAYSDGVSSTTGLAPNKRELGRVPHVPLMMIERRAACKHQNFDRDPLEYWHLVRERHRLAYGLV